MSDQRTSTTGGISLALTILLLATLLGIYTAGYLLLSDRIEVNDVRGRRIVTFALAWQVRIYQPAGSLESAVTGDPVSVQHELDQIYPFESPAFLEIYDPWHQEPITKSSTSQPSGVQLRRAPTD